MPKDRVFARAFNPTHWSGAVPDRASAWCATHVEPCLKPQSFVVPPDHHVPRIHYAPPCLAALVPSAWQNWDDIAAAITITLGSSSHGEQQHHHHHVWQGCPAMGGFEEGG
jgi:hypothetical protein